MNQIAALLLKPFGVKQVAEIGVAYTSQGMQNLFEQAKRSGQMDQDRHDLFTSVLQFHDQPVSSVMVPWSQVDYVEQGQGYGQMALLAAASGHSRFPVVDDGQVVGFLHVKDLLYSERIEEMGKGKDGIVRELLFIPPEMYLDELLRLMREQQIHFAVVGKKSEYIGIVTLEDVLESIVGDIIDETDRIDRTTGSQLQN